MANEDLVHARFYMHTVLNETKSKVANRPIFDEYEAVEIRFAANKKTVHVAPAHEVFKRDRNFATGDVVEITYAMAYNDQYKKFKTGAAQDQSGTPLSELTFLTQAKRLELKALNIHTAEALASVDGQPLKQLGMGGRELKNQAQAYLDSAAGSVDVTKLAARIAAMETENANLKGVEPGSADEKPSVTSPFADWDAEDIKNWIKENGGEIPRGNSSHATLVKRADKVNAELAEKAKEAA